MTNTIDANKIILTDVDGCLLNWTSMFDKWMQERGYASTDEHNHEYSLAKRYRMSEEKICALISQFNLSAAVGFCPAERDSMHYIPRLYERGYKFIAITAFGGDRFSRALRVQNLERIFGHVFVNHHFVGLNETKDKVLELFAGTEYWWIEDKLSNAEAGLKYGLRPILIRHPHNEHCDSDDILCVDNWKEAFMYITGEESL